MENKNVIKNEKFSKSDWFNMIFTIIGLSFTVGGIQRIIDEEMHFINWFWFIFGVIFLLIGILLLSLDCIKLMKNKKKGSVNQYA